MSDTNGVTFRHLLKMDWSQGHNQTIHNGISRIGWFKGGKAATWRDEDLGDQFVRKSVEWIRDNKDVPFFLFFAAQDIHVPRMPNERFQGATSMGYRGDAIVELDDKVGSIINIIEELELSEHTMIIFCSDNGAYPIAASNAPFRGYASELFEGGIHVPGFAVWPGRIEPVDHREQIGG